MSLFYKPVQNNSPSEDGEKKWHPHLVKIYPKVTTEILSAEIAERSSLTEGDVHNVIRNLLSSVRTHLLNSHSVKLDGFGTFTVKANSSGNGVSTPEEVNPRQITHLTVHFTPCYRRGLESGVSYPMFKGVNFVHVGDI